MRYLIDSLIALALVLLASVAMADGNHHHSDKVVVNNYSTYADGNTSKTIAAGQHHYKATPKIQWSVGAGFAGKESALSLGLGLQTGKVFWSGSITENTDVLFTDDSDPVVGLGASGEF